MYESRIIIVEVYREPEREYYGNIVPASAYPVEIASIELSSMPYGFSNIFQKEIDYDIVRPGFDVMTRTDCYGEYIKSCDVPTAIQWIENAMQRYEHYRRLEPLYGLLKGFNLDEWTCLEVLHYGH